MLRASCRRCATSRLQCSCASSSPTTTTTWARALYSRAGPPLGGAPVPLLPSLNSEAYHLALLLYFLQELALFVGCVYFILDFLSWHLRILGWTGVHVLFAHVYMRHSALFRSLPVNPVNTKKTSHRMFWHMHEVLNEVYLQNFFHRRAVNHETNLMSLLNTWFATVMLQ